MLCIEVSGLCRLEHVGWFALVIAGYFKRCFEVKSLSRQLLREVD